MIEDDPGGSRDPDEPGTPPTATAPLEPARPARSILPGLAIVGVLLGGAIFAAGYGLGQGSEGAVGQGGGVAAIAEAYDRITSDYVGHVDPDTLVGAAIGAMFQSLDDPYSSYMGADTFDSDLADVSGEFEGIGAQMVSEDADGAACEPMGDACQLRVVDVLTGSPAEDAGLLKDDVVRSIDSRPVTGMTTTDAVALIRGPSGSTVTLGVDRAGKPLDLAITRALIQAQDVRSETLAGGRVGYLRVDTFSAGASDDFHTQLGQLLDAGATDVVLDLRGDPGGFVDAAVTMASEFLGDGIVYQEEESDGARRAIDARPGGLATDPGVGVAVLIDGGTASASEIVAGALGTRDRATLVGEQSFGKGTIQEWTQLPGDNGGFRLSIARWLLPDGTSIDKVGIPPDIEVAEPSNGTDLADDPVVKAALATLLGVGGVDEGPVTSGPPSPALSPSSSPDASAPSAPSSAPTVPTIPPTPVAS